MQNEECSKAKRVSAPPEKRDYCRRLEEIVIPNQQKLLATARRYNVEVIYTVIESLTRDGRDRSLDHKVSKIHCPKGSWGAGVIDEVAPGDDDIIIPKTSSGIFNSTNFDYVLRNLGVNYLIIFGVVTDQCVESAIRDAADRGYLVTQIDDCCAAYTESGHNQSINAMMGHYCRTRTTEAIIAEIESLAAAAAG